jgi:uncharacterized membrane protein
MLFWKASRITMRIDPIIRHVRARPRLFICGLIGLAAIPLIPQSLALQPVTRALLGWNLGICLYLLLCVIMISRSTHEQICYQARLQDEGQWVILTLVMVAAIASLVAIIAELAAANQLHGALRYMHIGLALFTIVASWAFTHMMFGLHYAHDYYLAVTNGKPAGLEFPGDDAPNYGDFLYFAYVIGTSGQTADVNMTSNAMRRVGLLHCVLAFFFNTTVLALTINIAASLF